MYFRKEKYWLRYPGDIIAMDYKEACYIQRYLRRVQLNRTYFDSFEVIDLRRYRLIRKRVKVAEIIRRPSHEQYFLFPVGKN